MAFRLKEKPLIQRFYETIPRGDIRLIARQLPVYIPLLLRFVGEHLDQSPHLEFDLIWANTLFIAHGRSVRRVRKHIQGASKRFNSRYQNCESDNVASFLPMMHEFYSCFASQVRGEHIDTCLLD
jgi:hypothetical protein